MSVHLYRTSFTSVSSAIDGFHGVARLDLSMECRSPTYHMRADRLKGSINDHLAGEARRQVHQIPHGLPAPSPQENPDAIFGHDSDYKSHKKKVISRVKENKTVVAIPSSEVTGF